MHKLPTLYEKYGVTPVDEEGANMPDPGGDFVDDANAAEVVDIVDVAAVDPVNQATVERP